MTTPSNSSVDGGCQLRPGPSLQHPQQQRTQQTMSDAHGEEFDIDLDMQEDSRDPNPTERDVHSDIRYQDGPEPQHQESPISRSSAQQPNPLDMLHAMKVQPIGINEKMERWSASSEKGAMLANQQNPQGPPLPHTQSMAPYKMQPPMTFVPSAYNQSSYRDALSGLTTQTSHSRQPAPRGNSFMPTKSRFYDRNGKKIRLSRTGSPQRTRAELICANCGKTGHGHRECTGPTDMHGCIRGCGICNTMQHDLEWCNTPNPRDQYGHLLLRCRNNKPPIALSFDIRELPEFSTGKFKDYRPWTPAYAKLMNKKSNEPLPWDKWDHRDPTWDNPDIIPVDAFVHPWVHGARAQQIHHQLMNSQEMQAKDLRFEEERREKERLAHQLATYRERGMIPADVDEDPDQYRQMSDDEDDMQSGAGRGYHGQHSRKRARSNELGDDVSRQNTTFESRGRPMSRGPSFPDQNRATKAEAMRYASIAAGGHGYTRMLMHPSQKDHMYPPPAPSFAAEPAHPRSAPNFAAKPAYPWPASSFAAKLTHPSPAPSFTTKPTYPQPTPNFAAKPAYPRPTLSFTAEPAYPRPAPSFAAELAYPQLAPSFAAGPAHPLPALSFAAEPAYPRPAPSFAAEPAYPRPAPSFTAEPAYSWPMPSFAAKSAYPWLTPSFITRPAHPLSAPSFATKPTYLRPMLNFTIKPAYFWPTLSFIAELAYPQLALSFAAEPAYSRPAPSFAAGPVYPQPAASFSALGHGYTDHRQARTPVATNPQPSASSGLATRQLYSQAGKNTANIQRGGSAAALRRGRGGFQVLGAARNMQTERQSDGPTQPSQQMCEKCGKALHLYRACGS